MAKLLKIRREDKCVSCGVELAVGTTAYWFAAERHIKCVSCGATNSGSEPTAVPVDEVSRVADVAGGSARAEYEKRSARERRQQERAVAEDVAWRQQVKSRHRVLGPVVAALTPKPVIAETQATTAWKIGAEGEARVGQILADVPGIEVLHDRRWPGTRSANIDHIVVAPSGVFVIDAKMYRGNVELVDKGSWLRSDWRLYVNGRNQTKLVDSVAAQADAVRTLLGARPDVSVCGVLCLVGAEWGLLGPRKPKTLRGVTILWPLKLPDLVSAPGLLDVTATSAYLRGVLKPAK